ncbi:MAG: hypothetical protein KDB22_05605 [Planctomycetales bacterium]|nr:hypothetical protein [Planctomycetales bacterium]
MYKSSAILIGTFWALAAFFPCLVCPGQDGTRLPPGFERIHGQYVDLITDMPIDDRLRELPRIFDAAVPQWCEAFGMKQSEISAWHVDAYIMRARERFLQAGLLPGELPQFPYGFHWGNRIWVSEQDTDYYNRHLLLHEGTHWFMNRKYLNYGPPWLMEGMAEWYGTHYWDGESLQMGIIPKDKHDVPGWGRISLIQDQLDQGIAPSLETILRYDKRAHQQAEAYAWSWAAVFFLMHHPDSQAAFREMLKQPMKDDNSLTSWLFRRLRTKWSAMRSEWNATLGELEYGFDPSRNMFAFSSQPKRLEKPAVTVSIAANQGWQASGLVVSAGKRLHVQSSSMYVIGQLPKPWTCSAEGVTLEYYRGEPLGKLMMTVAAPIVQEPDLSEPLDRIAIGGERSLTLGDTGELFFRINEDSQGLSDNSGTIDITITAVP